MVKWNPAHSKDILGKEIPALAEKDPDVIYLDADLMSCIGTAKWGLPILTERSTAVSQRAT